MLLEFDLTNLELLDPLLLVLCLDFCQSLLLHPFLLSLFASCLYGFLPGPKFLLKSLHLLQPLLLIRATDVREALFVLLLDLLDLILGGYLGLLLPLSLVIYTSSSGLLFEKFSLSLAELSELLLLAKKRLLHLALFRLHFLETLLVVSFKICFKSFNVLFLLFVELLDHFAQKGVWQIFLEDLVLLFELLVLQLLNAPYFPILRALLDLSLDLVLLLYVLVVKVTEFLLQLLVNINYLVLIVLLLARIDLPSG